MTRQGSGGLLVSVLTFYSSESSLNLAEVYRRNSAKLLGKNKS